MRLFPSIQAIDREEGPVGTELNWFGAGSLQADCYPLPVHCGLQRIPPLSTTLCPHLIQRYAPTAYNVMPPTGRLGSVLSVIHAGRRVRVRMIHAGGMPAFSSSGAEDANLFTEVLLKSGR